MTSGHASVGAVHNGSDPATVRCRTDRPALPRQHPDGGAAYPPTPSRMGMRSEPPTREHRREALLGAGEPRGQRVDRRSRAEHGGALAYYTLFSLAPLLLIVTAVARLVFGEEAARGEIQAQLESLMGARSAGVVQDLLASVDQPAESKAAAALGVVLLLVGATTVFGELQNALDRIWRAREHPPSTGWISLVRERLLSFGMILAIGFLLMVSLVASATLAVVGRWWTPIFGDWYTLASLGNHAASFVLVSAIFALIYKVMPRVKVAWNDV